MYQLGDYYDRIKQPMDLSTVKNKFDYRQYANPEEFRDDMQLIAQNCLDYNSPDTKVHQAGKQFLVEFHFLRYMFITNFYRSASKIVGPDCHLMNYRNKKLKLNQRQVFLFSLLLLVRRWWIVL